MDPHGVFRKVTQGSPLGLRQITGAEGERRIPKVEMWKPTWVGPQKFAKFGGPTWNRT